MAHLAKIENGIVVQVIPAAQAAIDAGVFGPGWVQTSYNTFGGQHRLGGIPLRKNYAGIGYTYDSERDAFIPPKFFTSWVLDETTCLWNPPVEMPSDDKSYKWDEESLSWKEITV
jgi:hypothetical protein